MAVEREHGAVLILCDSCGDYVEGDDFEDARECARAEGYTFARDRGEWTHTCLSCNRKGDEKDGTGMPDEAW